MPTTNKQEEELTDREKEAIYAIIYLQTAAGKKVSREEARKIWLESSTWKQDTIMQNYKLRLDGNHG